MRLLLSILLITTPVLAHELVKVTVRRPGGTVVAVAPLTSSAGNFPLCVVHTPQHRHRLVGYGLDGVEFYNAGLSTTPLGMRNIGGTVYLAQRSGKTVSTLRIRMLRGVVAPSVGGAEELTRRATFLRIIRGASGPLLVFGEHRDIIHMVDPGSYRNRVRLNSSVSFLGCTDRFDADSDRRPDLMLLTDGGRLVRLEAHDRTSALHAHQNYPYRTEGVLATSIAAAGNQVWIGGSRRGKAALLLFDPNAVPAIHKFKDLFKGGRGGGRDPRAQYEFGRGTIDGIEILDARHLVLAGTRAGSPWIAVVTRTGRATVVDEAVLSGKKITAFCVNPKRIGWTVAAGTDDGKLHVLRSPGDRKATRQSPTPRPERRPEHDPTPGTGTGTGTAHVATAAYFPRIEAGTRRGLDTVLYLLYLGARPARLVVRYYDASGRLVAQQPITARRKTRTRLSLVEMLRNNRIPDLDGWAVVTGCDKRDLIASGLLYRGTANPESLRPFWR